MSACNIFLLSIQAIHPTIVFPFPNVRINAMIVASMSKKSGNTGARIIFLGLNISSHDRAVISSHDRAVVVVVVFCSLDEKDFGFVVFRDACRLSSLRLGSSFSKIVFKFLSAFFFDADARSLSNFEEVLLFLNKGVPFVVMGFFKLLRYIAVDLKNDMTLTVRGLRTTDRSTNILRVNVITHVDRFIRLPSFLDGLSDGFSQHAVCKSFGNRNPPSLLLFFARDGSI